MKKITALFFVIISLIFFFKSTSFASDWYTATLTREIYLDNTLSFNVTNTFSLKNTSSKYLIKSFDYFSPLAFTNVEASINGKKLTVSITGSHINIDLGDNVLRPLMSESLVIKLKVPELVKSVKSDSGEVLGAELFLPKDTTKSLDIFSQTTIIFDSTQFTPSYISTENIKETSKIHFTKNVDIFIDFSQVGGFTISYTGSNSKVLLPSSVFNNLIYDNIPQDGLLSNDKIGNTYIEKSDTLEYYLTAFGNTSPNLQKNEQPVYFSKNDLSEFKLDNDVKSLYRQVIDIFSPETQKLNTQMLSYAEYRKNNFNDSLAYSLTLASLLQQKNLNAQVVFGKVVFPLSQNQIWHFWVVYSQDNILYQLDPYMEDLLGFDGYNNISSQRAIVAGYYNDPILISAIDNLMSGTTTIEFTKTGVLPEGDLAKLEVTKIPDSFYPKLNFTYKNLSSSAVTITGISLNGSFNSVQNVQVLPGSQKDFEISLSLNILDIIADKGNIKITASVMDNGDAKTYDTNTNIPPQVLLWIVMVNFVSVFVGLSIILIFAKYKRIKIH